MSDYIEDQEYSMQLAAPGDDPFAYDWARLQEEVDGATSSWFGDITLASLQEPMDVDNVDLSALNHDIENGPWRDLFDWSPKVQGMDAQPGDRNDAHSNIEAGLSCPDLMPDDNIQPSGTPVNVEWGLVCDHPKCGKAFKRKGDLTRHKKLHERKRDYPCPAQECKFSFTRNDKLLDHIRAGHDADVLFACDDPLCTFLLTKDILPLHRHCHSNYRNLERYRQCPLPRCGFRTRSELTKIDDMQKHLLKSHDPKGRKQYTSLLASRGYDFDSGKILCPICPNVSLFNKHRDFGFHLLAKHCPDWVVDENPQRGPRVSWNLYKGGAQWGAITDEQRKHRRTILSLFPQFKSHPVWRDMESCTSRGI